MLDAARWAGSILGALLGFLRDQWSFSALHDIRRYVRTEEPDDMIFSARVVQQIDFTIVETRERPSRMKLPYART